MFCFFFGGQIDLFSSSTGTLFDQYHSFGTTLMLFSRQGQAKTCWHQCHTAAAGRMIGLLISSLNWVMSQGTIWEWSITDLVADILFCSARMPKLTLRTRRIWWGCWFSHRWPDSCHRLYQFSWLSVASESLPDLMDIYNCL